MNAYKDTTYGNLWDATNSLEANLQLQMPTFKRKKVSK